MDKGSTPCRIGRQWRLGRSKRAKDSGASSPDRLAPSIRFIIIIAVIFDTCHILLHLPLPHCRLDRIPDIYLTAIPRPRRLAMSPQRYAAVSTPAYAITTTTLTLSQLNQQDEDDNDSPITPTANREHPSSPPPSFRSRNSSPTSRRLLRQDPLNNEADQDLADTFDDGEDSDAENDGDDRQRLMRADTSRSISITGQQPSQPQQPPRIERRITELPAFQPRAASTRGGPKPTNDGVFANLSAKPTAGEPVDDKPPTYEQAAADATPPYWETTILAPGMSSDEVYVDGLPVGSVFSFIWNGMISMSFLFPGFLLTYLLHTTHAAKNGSLAGLGLTLVQYGFYMRGSGSADTGNPGQFAGAPPDPNSHNFDPNNPTGDNGQAGQPDGSHSGLSSGDFISYGLMIIGWFILIRAVSGFLRARRHEQLVLQSPTRGLSVPVVAEGEGEQAA